MLIKILANTVKGASMLLLFLASDIHAQSRTSYIRSYGYDSCIHMTNGLVDVVLEPNAGGRVICYALKTVNVLYEDSMQNGWISTVAMPRSKGHLAGGRFDIGPSRTKPNTDLFFFGKWKALITSDSSARLISQVDTVSKVYLIRDFTLDQRTSKLACSQTIVNGGIKSIDASFWSRTFASGNGICVMPVAEKGRFPNKYVMFMNRDTINMLPVDSNIIIQNEFLIVKGPPKKPKLEMDVDAAGWIAYATTSNLLFIKKYKVFQDRRYGDVTAANASVWYNGRQMTEIEPIGPLETILPGQWVSFVEDWYLVGFSFPADRNIRPELIRTIVDSIK